MIKINVFGEEAQIQVPNGGVEEKSWRFPCGEGQR